jgi:hypothetical protein
MKCILCKHLNLKANVAMAKLGFGKCGIDKVQAHSVSFRFERVCKDDEQVSEAVAMQRTVWADNSLKARMLKG